MNFTALPIRFIRTETLVRFNRGDKGQSQYLGGCEHSQQKPLFVLQVSQKFPYATDLSTHSGTLRSISKDKSSFFAAIGNSNSMQSCDIISAFMGPVVNWNIPQWCSAKITFGYSHSTIIQITTYLNKKPTRLQFHCCIICMRWTAINSNAAHLPDASNLL